MTQSEWKKLMKQIEKKPVKLKKFIKYCKPKDRKYGMTVHRCVKCGRIGAHVGSYGIHLCRQCFREIAPQLGFKKYS